MVNYLNLPHYKSTLLWWLKWPPEPDPVSFDYVYEFVENLNSHKISFISCTLNRHWTR